MGEGSESVEAVLFDFGGVISVDPFRTMGSAAAAFAIDPMEFADIAIGVRDYGAGDHPWHQLERGEIEVDDYNRAVDALAKDRGLAGFPPLPVDMIVGSVSQLHPEMLDLIGTLRHRGIATAVVTNNVRALSGWRSTADWDALVDVVVDSWEVGMRKPEARMFLHVCSALGVEPSASLFLDDMRANIDGATAVGLRAMHVTDPVEAAAAVMRLIG